VYTATWTPKTYTVQFDANGGDVSQATGTVSYEGTYGELPTPQKAGYTFTGWTALPSEYQQVEYVQFDSSDYIDTGVIPSNHMTEMKFKANEGDYLFGTSQRSTNYHFTIYDYQYYWGENGSEGHGGTFTDDVHKLIYNADNNSVLVDDILIGSGKDISASTNLWIGRRGDQNHLLGRIYNMKITNKSTENVERNLIPCYRKSDNTLGLYDLSNDQFYTGIIYAKGADVNLSAESKIVTNANHKLIANWTGNTYYVKFNANGGTGSMENQTMTYGTASNLTANAYTKEGYVFKGWNTQADGNGTSYANSESVCNLTATSGATINLYAQWEEVDYGKKVNYSVTVNGQKLDNWKYFMADDDGYAYIIYGDYLPNAAIPATAITGGNLQTDGEYRVWSARGASDFINVMNTQTYWSSLITNSLSTAAENLGKTATATGSPTVSQFIKSWNNKYTEAEEQVNVPGNETSGWSDFTFNTLAGYAVNEEENMYCPHKEVINDGEGNSGRLMGYWLASKFKNDDSYVMLVDCRGNFGANSYNLTYRAVRPVIRVPSELLELNKVDGESYNLKFE
jgi:uncharacterized repeat protein (TIGR02543 family)